MSTPAPTCKKALADATAKWPNRDRKSDGIMGDAAHQARKSDHNDGNAFDLTQDPLNGVNCNELSLTVINDPRVKYVIWKGRIWKDRTKQWEVYRGSNQHNHHMHVSIYSTARNDLRPWPWSTAEGFETLRLNSQGASVRVLQSKLGIPVDGVFGVSTENAVEAFQTRNGLTADGIVGKKTWEALG